MRGLWFDNFYNIGAGMLDFVHHMTLKLHSWLEKHQDFHIFHAMLTWM